MALAALSACGGGGSDPDSPEYLAFIERDAVMADLRDGLLPLNQMVSEEIPVDEALFLASARSLAANAPRVLDGFDNQTVVPESRSTPEIWANWADFESKGEALQSAANALAAAAESGGFAAGRELVRGVRDTCSGCHTPYRGPEPD
jgi:cytochrome c556